MDDIGIVQGVVIEVDHKLLSFEVEHARMETSRLTMLYETPKTTVFLVLMFMENPTQKFPEIGSTVTIKSPFCNGDKYICAMVVTPGECEIEGILTVTPISNAFIEIVKDLNLQPPDLLLLVKNYENLKRSGIRLDISCSDILLEILQTLRHVNFELQFLNRIRYIDEKQNSYKQFSYWTFGTHYNWSEKYLLGFFFVDNTKGTIYFTDTTRKIPCVFVNNQRNEVLQFSTSLILMKDFMWMTEIYNSGKLCPTMEYFLIDLNKIIKLKTGHPQRQVLCGVPQVINDYMHARCTVISKSQLIAVSTYETNYWTEVVLDTNIHAFYRLKTGFRCLYPFIRPGQSYTMYYKQMPNRINDYVMDRLAREKYPNNFVHCYDVWPGTHFVPLEYTNSYFPDVSDAFKKLTSYGLFSFEATISLKLFNNPIPSSTRPVTSDPIFGTPGVKTHKIVFLTNDEKIEVYLNNWENLYMPYGLIPDMRVIVHNVKPQSGKYYKSTLLTSFEIISYEPKLKFETANLHLPDWGLPFFLGTGFSIPNFAILWGRVTIRSILSLKIYTQNNIPQRKINGHITLIVEDPAGESKILAKENGVELLLRLLLGLHEPRFKEWVEGFHHWGSFTYRAERQELDILSKYLKQLETRNSYKLNLLCRKMDNEPSRMPIYYLLDGDL